MTGSDARYNRNFSDLSHRNYCIVQLYGNSKRKGSRSSEWFIRCTTAPFIRLIYFNTRISICSRFKIFFMKNIHVHCRSLKSFVSNRNNSLSIIINLSFYFGINYLFCIDCWLYFNKQKMNHEQWSFKNVIYEVLIFSAKSGIYIRLHLN